MNWGQKILTGMVFFMAFIITLGIIMLNSNNDALIEQDYYEQGLNYDQNYKAKQATIRDSIIPEFKISGSNVIIAIPVKSQYILTCKRLANANMDRTFTGEGSTIIIPIRTLTSGGLWLFKLSFRTNGKDYLIEREINI